MLDFRVWLEKQEGIPDEAIKVQLPSVRMQREGACGAQAFRAICLYYNVGPDDEKGHMKLLGTTSNGTWPESIIKHAKELKFQVESKTGMTIRELVKFLNKRIPVICAMQAWGEPSKYHTDASGHYVVAIGYDQEKIYFEDPSIDGGKRGFLPYKEFLRRWHDVDAHGHDCNQLGIAMWRDDPEPQKKITTAKRLE